MSPASWKYKLLILVVAAAGLGTFLTLTLSRSQPGRRPGGAAVPVVEVIEARPAAVPVRITAMGGVQAAQSVRVVPQVSGKVVFVSPQLVPGGHLKKDQILVQIDPRDYELTIRGAQAEVAQAQLAVDVQVGQRSAAKRELQLVGSELVPTQEGLRLASKQSHLDNATAQLDAARSRLEQAQLALSRTSLRAPFDARVQDKSVDVGQVVSTQSVVATLYASDEAWVEADLPTEQLRWIAVPGLNAEQGAQVLVRQRLASQVEITRHGQVLGLLPSLTERGKLARLLIRIHKPFVDGSGAASSQPAEDSGPVTDADDDAPLPLLVGAFVHLEIEGRTLPDLLALPRVALREGDKVWVRDQAGTLAVRPVEVVWRDQETVYVRGAIAEPERVIVSHLASPIPGMRLALPDEPDSNAPGGRSKSGTGDQVGMRKGQQGAVPQ